MNEDDFLEAQYEDRFGYPDDDEFDDYYEELDDEGPYCSLHDAEHRPGGLLCEVKSQETYYGTD